MNILLNTIPVAPPGGFQGRGPLGLEGSDPTLAGDTLSNVISTAIGVMTAIAFIWFIFLLLMGALGIMTAGGDKAKVEAARARISNGLIGLVITISVVGILVLVATILGLEGILDLQGVIGNLSP
ncbi:hypothetical protein A2803_01490 [Candidatus Woesebacteria bacterium RIFCSPHIGHO2_01_FULL_44_21]|uniref:Uncharacterized protein n=1 Tax=Candidatus Woesebacteria bacterium RIFCSPHIGHO2_01_FULL_44_21 TaxID=1802503 RepID=A0A1F7Z0T4_9BACT|nr:MAG: hypothetical protein A2803_01490 [Candidatus Woesebacteria bacterium RIFCSPHIGHO2_01_FULL_44_21]